MKASFECEKGGHFEGRELGEENFVQVNWSKFQTQVKRVWIIKTCKERSPCSINRSCGWLKWGIPKVLSPLSCSKGAR